MTDDILFDVPTPLGFSVRVTRRYWELIVTIKHPVMRGARWMCKRLCELLIKSGKVAVTGMYTSLTTWSVPGVGFAQ
jgi:hypothetical protein